jgi:transcriptional regulator with XRE-family HTH domain
MLSHELDRVGVRPVVLLVARRDGVERDPELLEDRAPLRARRRQQERRSRGRAQLVGHIFVATLEFMVSGILLREARLRAGLSQAELARRAGKARSAIGRWERGEVQPSFETLRELVRACGLEIGYRLIEYDDNLDSLVEESLRLTPAERFERLSGWTRFLTEARESLARA